MIDLGKAIDRGYAAVPALQWPTMDGKYLDRSKFVTSSEVSQCPRRIKYRKVTQQGNGKLHTWGFAERGNHIEIWVVEMLRSGGLRVHYALDDQLSYYHDNQSGTPDGLLKYKDGWIVLEIKSIDPRTNYSNLPKPEHRDQVQQNIDLVSAWLSQYDEPVYGSILFYQDASNFQKRKQFFIEPDHVAQEMLQEKAEKIQAAASPADLPPLGLHTGDCDRCEFVDECSALVAGIMEERAPNVFK